MDFLNSLGTLTQTKGTTLLTVDLHPPNKKSHRMRSWYLYEQYKSLERNQLDAAQRLKDKVTQERILSQELNERRARRNLYDRFGLCQSETGIESSSFKTTGAKTDRSGSNDDFFESFCEFQDNSMGQSKLHDKIDDTFSDVDLMADKLLTDEFKSVEEQNDSNPDSVTSVVENYKAAGNFSDDTKGTLDLCNVADRLNMQLEAAKENIQGIAQYTKLSDDGNSSEASSFDTIEEPDPVDAKTTFKQDRENNVLAAWSKLVSFAYQVVQLNHGNCYYDYGSQFMTAVLACDVLRRGINCMCNILQPYVSPIKFATDDSDSSAECLCRKKVKSKKSAQSKKLRKDFEFKFPSKRRYRSSRRSKCPCRKYHSEDYGPHYSRHTENRNKCRLSSEPWRSEARLSSSKKDGCHKSSISSIWPDFSTDGLDNPQCDCDPMLKIAHYIENILKDIDDCQND